MADNGQYHGHMTLVDGSRVALSADEAKRLWEDAERATAQAAMDMPAAGDAMAAISRAKERLRKLGWSDGIYCPKDGSTFAIIEFGSTGIFQGFYSGTWPDGDLHYCGCVSDPHGTMWKSLANLTCDEREVMDRCMETERAMVERQFRMAEAIEAEANG
jgi:hypothetical protein